MSSSPTPSVLDPTTQLFPVLTPAQIDRVRSLGRVRDVTAGEILFRPHDVGVSFFVILSGRLDIVQLGLDGELPVTSHGPGQFTGELTMISGQSCLVLGRVSESGEFLEVDSQSLHLLIARDSELSDILMRAFILRRLGLISGGYGNVVLMVSRDSAKTLQLREFLSRNVYPHRYVDLDVDQDSQELLDRFAVKASEVPVVICSGGNVLRNPTIQHLASCMGIDHVVESQTHRDVVSVGACAAGLAAAV